MVGSNETSVSPETPFSTLHHIIQVVDRLGSAITEFQQKGFTVIPLKNKSDGIIESAEIRFQDGTFIQLISFSGSVKSLIVHQFARMGLIPMRPRSIDRRTLCRMAQFPRGMIDFVLIAADLEEDIRRMMTAGVPISAVQTMKRRVNTGDLTWKTAIPDVAELPLLVSPYSLQPIVREDAAVHANGALGLKKIRVFTRDLARTSEYYQAFLGIQPKLYQIGKTPVVSFAAGVCSIDVMDSGGTHIPRGGTGTYAIELSFPDIPAERD